MKLFTLGSSKKSAEEFFNIINSNNIDLLIDVRLNNKSQLLGFSKGKDLKFFLKKLSNCKYTHETKFSPTKEILDDYKNKKISWTEYEILYNKLIENRNVVDYFNEKYSDKGNIVFLCSEPTSQNCHRRLLSEKIAKNKEDITHL